MNYLVLCLHDSTGVAKHCVSACFDGVLVDVKLTSNRIAQDACNGAYQRRINSTQQTIKTKRQAGCIAATEGTMVTDGGARVIQVPVEPLA